MPYNVSVIVLSLEVRKANECVILCSWYRMVRVLGNGSMQHTSYSYYKHFQDSHFLYHIFLLLIGGLRSEWPCFILTLTTPLLIFEICVYLCVCMCARMCTRMCLPGVDIVCFPLSFATLWFEIGSHIDYEDLWFGWVVWLVTFKNASVAISISPVLGL